MIEGALAYSMMFAMLPAMITEINGPQLRYFAGQMDKHQYLTETVRYYGAVDYLGDHVKPDSLILRPYTTSWGHLSQVDTQPL